MVEGQIFAKPATKPGLGNVGAYQTVPKGLVQGDAPAVTYGYCYHWAPARSAACAPVPGAGGKTPTTVITGAGRYNPVYYAAVGEPLVLWPNWTGILLARLISAALCAAFLASAWLSCLEWRRSRLLIAGLLVAATPAFFELTGAVNPNSLEIAAGISLAAAAIPLLLDGDSPHAQRWLRRAARNRPVPGYRAGTDRWLDGGPAAPAVPGAGPPAMETAFGPVVVRWGSGLVRAWRAMDNYLKSD